MTAAAAEDLSDDGRPESAMTRCGSGKDEVAERESPPPSDGKFSPPLAMDYAAVDVADATTAAILEVSGRAALSGGGSPKGLVKKLLICFGRIASTRSRGQTEARVREHATFHTPISRFL